MNAVKKNQSSPLGEKHLFGGKTMGSVKVIRKDGKFDIVLRRFLQHYIQTGYVVAVV
jgi:hypothetical protein